MRIATALEEANTFAELEKLFDTIDPQVTLLGCRRITSSQHEGSLPIDRLIQRVKAVKAANLDFDEGERVHAKNIMMQVRAIYEKSDELIEQCYSIIQWLDSFKFLVGIFEERLVWEWRDCCFHARYTQNQFETVFGYPPPSEENLTYEQIRDRGVERERLPGNRYEWFVSDRYITGFALPEDLVSRWLLLRVRKLQLAQFGSVWV